MSNWVEAEPQRETRLVVSKTGGINLSQGVMKALGTPEHVAIMKNGDEFAILKGDKTKHRLVGDKKNRLAKQKAVRSLLGISLINGYYPLRAEKVDGREAMVGNLTQGVSVPIRTIVRKPKPVAATPPAKETAKK